MAKQARASDITRETKQELIEKVQSQAATIGALEERFQTQSAYWRELSTLYGSRCERLEERCRTCFIFWLRPSSLILVARKDQYEEEAAIASSEHRTEVDMLRKRLEGEFLYLFRR
jgi:hypothetical protein